MSKEIKIIVSLVIIVILLTGACAFYIFQNKTLAANIHNTVSNETQNNLYGTSTLITQDSTSTLVQNEKLDDSKALSGKCGYEYFYKTNDGKLTRLNKVVIGKSPVEGMSLPVFNESVSKWDDVLKKIKEPVATVIVMIYTDTCKDGISVPTYYYKEGQEVVKENVEGSSAPITEIIKGKTFEDIKSTIFSNETAKLMECDFETTVGSAEKLLGARTIAYTPISVAGRGFFSKEQNTYVIKSGGRTLPIDQNNYLYVDVSITDEDSSYSPKYDCGKNLNQYTVFLESLDMPNVLVRRFDKGQQDSTLWSDIIIVK